MYPFKENAGFIGDYNVDIYFAISGII